MNEEDTFKNDVYFEKLLISFLSSEKYGREVVWFYCKCSGDEKLTHGVNV